MISLSKKQAWLAGFTLLLVGVVSTTFWHSLHSPMKPLYVELLNDTSESIPVVEIEYGSQGLQEKVLLLRLKPNERRVIALNHKPGMGFNIAVVYANQEKTEICAGKNKAYWFFRATITKHGIYTTPIR